VWLPATLLTLVTLAAFLPTLWNGFVDWDDPQNLLQNPHYRGLGWSQIRWMATTSHFGHWVPMTWLTFGLDYVIWGMNPRGYHLTSLLIHVGSTLALYALARAVLVRALPLAPATVAVGGMAAALLFGLHPLRVEAVAWATERREVLAGFLCLVALAAYVRSAAADGSRRRLLAASIVAYAAALLSKSSGVTLPLVLVLLDVYPLRRLPPNPLRWAAAGDWPVLVEKLPYVALSIVQGLVTYGFFRADFGRAITPVAWPEGLARMLLSAWAYPVRTIVPAGLSPLYEAPADLRLLDARVLMAAGGVALVTGLAWLSRRRCPGLGVAWASYLVLLLPVAGMLPLGYHLTADRYTYLPCVGFAVLAGGGVAVLAEAAMQRGSPRLAGLTVGVAGVIILTLAVATWRQVHVWKDTATLWRHAVDTTPDCAVCRVNHGHALLAAGEAAAALEHFRHAVALRPIRADFYRNVGLALEALGRREEAIAWFREGLALQPTALAVRVSLAAALVRQGRLAEAVEALDRAWRLHEPAALARYFEDAVRHRPEAPVARLGLVRAWLELGERERARAEHEVLRRLHSGLATLVRDGS
jgi:hypothetical protein